MDRATMPCAMPTGSQKFGNKTVSPFLGRYDFSDIA